MKTIEESLFSVHNQSYSNKEHVIIDGVSTDGTLELLQAHRKSFDVLISEPDKGIYDALNKGILHSSGDILGFLHSDDLFAHPKVLETVANAFNNDPSICAVYGDLVYVNIHNTDKVVRKWKSSVCSDSSLRWGWMPPHPTLYVRREWYEKIGGFDTNFLISADYLSILLLFSNPRFNATHISDVFVKMRLGGISNRSLGTIIKKSAEDFRALRTSGVGAFYGIGALIWKNLSKLKQFF